MAASQPVDRSGALQSGPASSAPAPLPLSELVEGSPFSALEAAGLLEAVVRAVAAVHGSRRADARPACHGNVTLAAVTVAACPRSGLGSVRLAPPAPGTDAGAGALRACLGCTAPEHAGPSDVSAKSFIA